jgi:L-rhamnose 1-dehydrogenase
MQSVAITLGPHKIRCNSIMPGVIETDINQEDLSNPARREHYIKRIPLRRLGKPEDIAECVAFIASDRAAYVNGAALLVDGGMYVNLH